MIHFQARFPLNFRESKGIEHDLYSPNNREVLTKIQYANSDDIDYVLKILPKAQALMMQLAAFTRADILKKVARQIEENTEKLAWLIATEGGKPLKDARVEVGRAKVTLELCAEEALRLGGENIPMQRTAAALDHMAITYSEPIGPVLAISAFNHPLNLLAHQIGCAIAAGNAVVVKPAPGTPLSAFELEKYFLQAGLPAKVLLVVNCDIPEIEKMISSPTFSFVSFIGSATVGWNIRKKLAPGTRLALEHGGQAPAVVRADADMKLASEALVKGAFYHAGQVCISTQKIFVHENIFEEFLELFCEAAEKLKTGDATLDSTDIGPLIRPEEVRRIQEWIQQALAEGAKLKLGNETSGKENQFLSPTILTHVPESARLMNEEVFGPVVCINSYTDEEELVNLINQNDYIFEGCLFSQDITAAIRLARKMSSMTIVINNHNAYRVDWMPFGGHKLSGLGMGGVKYSISEMSRLKQLIIKY